MSLAVNYNSGAAVALRYAAVNAQSISSSMAKLSSGSRIVSARDDAASLAIGSRLAATVAALQQAQVNAGQGAAMLQVADGAAGLINDILTRMNTLAVQAASAQLSNNERSIIDTEFQSLGSEIDRIAGSTQFNGNHLIDNSGIVYTIRSASAHGTLFRAGIALGLGDSFTQSDLDNGIVKYLQDGSGTTTDRVIVSIANAAGDALGTVTGEGSAASFQTAEYFASGGLSAINASTAYARAAAYGVTGAGSGIKVAVIDTGVDTDHPDLAPNLLAGTDVGDGDANPEDDSAIGGHGTHVAGIIAATSDGTGMEGVAYNARIIPVKVAHSDGSFTDVDVANAVDFAVANGAKVINLSLAVSLTATLYNSLVNAINNDVVIVAAAGNFRGNPDPALAALAVNPVPPAILAIDPNAKGAVIAVGALDGTDLASFSDLPGVAKNFYVVAPGVNINSTTNDGGYGLKSGTSMASPEVAGAAAVLRELFPTLNATEIANLIDTSARDAGDPGTDAVFGRGILDLARASNPQQTIDFNTTVGGIVTLAGNAVNVGSVYDDPMSNLFTRQFFKVGDGSAANDRITVDISALTRGTLGLKNIDVSTANNADAAIAALDSARTRILTMRADIGSNQNRLNFAAGAISNATINTEAARSTLLDLDIAQEMSRMVSKRILTDVSTTMLATANQQAQLLLRLVS